MVVAEIELYKILKTKFTEVEAETIVAGIGQKVQSNFEERKNEFATKEDIPLLREDFLKLQIDMEKRFNQLTIWIIGTSIALAGIIIAVTRFK